MEFVLLFIRDTQGLRPFECPRELLSRLEAFRVREGPKRGQTLSRILERDPGWIRRQAPRGLLGEIQQRL